MTRRFPDLGSSSDWLKQISHTAQPIRNTTQIWVVARLQCGVFALFYQTLRLGETSGGVAKCWLFDQAMYFTECKNVPRPVSYLPGSLH